MTNPTDISVAFIKQFESEVHLKYQQEGSLLRNMVRTKNNVKGKSTTFQIIGKGSASTKNRHGTVTPMNLVHTNVEVTLSDFYAGEWVDKLDELKTNIDERGAVAKTEGYALGRKTDDLIITALASATTTVNATAALNLSKVLEAFAKFNELEVPDDGERYAVVTPKAWNELLQIDQFAKSDYVEDKPFMKGKNCKKWLGINWCMHSGLPTTTTGEGQNAVTTATCFLFHKSAIGFASGADVTTDITWHGDHAAHFINSMMSQGAGLIDDDGVIKITVAA
jgi:hypothetical protein